MGKGRATSLSLEVTTGLGNARRAIDRQVLVRTAGLEPARPEGQEILSLRRLPVPPRPHLHGMP